MQQTELDRPTMEDRKPLEEQIKELEQKIKDSNDQQDKLYGKENRQILPEVWRWNKELRRLRRLRK